MLKFTPEMLLTITKAKIDTGASALAERERKRGQGGDLVILTCSTFPLWIKITKPFLRNTNNKFRMNTFRIPNFIQQESNDVSWLVAFCYMPLLSLFFFFFLFFFFQFQETEINEEEEEGLVSLFNGISTFVGYSVSNHPYRRTAVILFNP